MLRSEIPDGNVEIISPRIFQNLPFYLSSLSLSLSLLDFLQNALENKNIEKFSSIPITPLLNFNWEIMILDYELKLFPSSHLWS